MIINFRKICFLLHSLEICGHQTQQHYSAGSDMGKKYNHRFNMITKRGPVALVSMTAQEFFTATEASGPILQRCISVWFTDVTSQFKQKQQCFVLSANHWWPGFSTHRMGTPHISQSFSFPVFSFTVEKDRRLPLLPWTYKYSELLSFEYTSVLGSQGQSTMAKCNLKKIVGAILNGLFSLRCSSC